MNPCWKCQDKREDCHLACSRYQDWIIGHSPSEVPGGGRENHRWADPEHPSDGERYSSIGRRQNE